MKLVVSIVGARPQFVKAAVVSSALSRVGGMRELLLHTGQHFDNNMSNVFFRELSIPEPAYNLGVSGGNHGAMTGLQLAGIEEVLLKERPDLVIVYGDTNSTLAGALAAAKINIPVAHVEAGLRSFNRRMPEEVNRVLSDHLGTWLFAPTIAAMENLRREGIDDSKCYCVGDVMFDAALRFRDIATTQSRILERVGCVARQFALVTVHRAENTDDPQRLAVILEAVAKVAERIPVVWPIHPRTRKAIDDLGLASRLGGAVKQIEPVGYLDMVMLESAAAVISTDSGGVQKEAFFFGVPCVTLRNETEWVELVDLGWNELVPPTDPSFMAERVLSRIGTSGKLANPYGAGAAALEIATVLSRA
jgi:UDP-GlcNAc3NAcA epimerase